MSSAVGWVISLGKLFEEEGKGDVSSSLLPSVREAMPGVDPRLCTGYACLLYFAEKVLTVSIVIVAIISVLS